MTEIDLDALDRSIIDRLSKNARVSNREIAREFGLTEGTIRARLKRLSEQNAIRVTAVTNIARLRNPILAYLWIEVDSSGQLAAVMEALANLPEIGFVASLIGRADILAMTLVRDATDLAQYLHETVDQIPGIYRIQYSLAHRFIKYDYRNSCVIA